MTIPLSVLKLDGCFSRKPRRFESATDSHRRGRRLLTVDIYVNLAHRLK